MIQSTGYLHPRYAKSFSEFGAVRELPACGGWILERDIPGTPHHDAMGLYPLFCCQDWSLLQADLEQLEGQLVSLALVTDPFGSFTEDDLKPHFDVFFRYKEHYVADLSMPIEKIVSKGHRKNARKALRNVKVDTCLYPLECVEEWSRLYEFLVKRHQIQGMRRFSKAVFEKQLQVPGVVYFRVLHNEEIVGGDIYYLQNDVAYAHLAAFTDEGYVLGAPYAVKWVSFQYFAEKANWVNLGAGVGLDQNNKDGLAMFKQGWSTGRRPVYFSGRIFDREEYSRLSEAKRRIDSSFFPIYRTGEFS